VWLVLSPEDGDWIDPDRGGDLGDFSAFAAVPG
jgi:hypothetical protein